jgi:DNA polymerase
MAEKAVKLRNGPALIQYFCVPDKKGNFHAPGDSPQDWEAFKNYCRVDVEAMRRCHQVMPTWNYTGPEHRLWVLDYEINQRGLPVDLEAIEGALQAVRDAQAQMDKRTHQLTGGALASATQRDALLSYLYLEEDAKLPEMTKAAVAEALAAGDLSPVARELLEIRADRSRTSTAKFRKMRDCAVGGRIRNGFTWCGAGRTRRWAGRLVQWQNLYRGSFKTIEERDATIAAMVDGSLLELYADPIEAAASTIRGMIKAPPGKKFVVSDLSNIEGRVLAWLAGEQWKLDAFQAYDDGVGPDLYVLAFAKSFGVAPQDVDKDERQIGKVQELSLGYEGGVGAYVAMGKGYGMEFDALVEPTLARATERQIARASRALCRDRRQGRYEALSDEVYVALDVIKQGWREGHPGVRALWRDLDDAMRQAIVQPNTVVECGEVSFEHIVAPLDVLLVHLPSGGRLHYHHPKIRDVPRRIPKGQGEYDTRIDKVITYWGPSQEGKGPRKAWAPIGTFGGKICENIVQAIARDVMAANMPAIDEAGYRIIGTVHDEVITETPDSPEYTAEGLSTWLARVPEWAPGLPLSASGFEAKRYRKD